MHSARIANTVDSLPPLLGVDAEDDDDSIVTALSSASGRRRPPPLDVASTVGAVVMASGSIKFSDTMFSNKF